MSWSLVQAIAAATQPGGLGIVQVPVGEWQIPDAVQCGCRIVGAGPALCRLSGGSICFDECGSMSGVGMDGLHLPGSVGLLFLRSTSRVLDDVQVDGYDINIHVQSGSGWSMVAVKSTGYLSHGLVVENTANADEGDWHLIASVFDSGSSQTAISGLHHLSSGGANILSTKFLGGKWGILGEINGITSDLIVLGCSVENQTVTKIAYRTNGGSFRNVIIQACQGMGSSADFHLDGIPFDVITGNLDTSADNQPAVTQGPSEVKNNLDQAG